MTSPNWSQFSGQVPGAAPGPQGFTPPTAPAQPAPAGFGPPPGFGAPAGFAPATPPQHPGYSQPAPGFPPQAAPAFAPPMAPQSQTAAFGAGAFAGAQPMSGRKDCAPGVYVLEITETDTAMGLGGQGALMWRMTFKVAHVFEGTQPLGSEVTDAQQGATAIQQKYVGEAMLNLSCAALNIPSPDALRQALAGQVPAGVDGWTEFSNALQKAAVPMSQYFPPNPLKGKYVLARVGARQITKGPKAGTVVSDYKYAPAPAGQ